MTSNMLGVPILLFLFVSCLQADESINAPVGRCEAGKMIISIPQTSSHLFTGIVHAKGYRNNPHCFSNGSVESFASPVLVLNLLAEPKDPDYCGIVTLKEGREKAVSIAVRIHSALELQEDRYFLLTCANLKVASRSSRTSKSLFKDDDEGLTFYGLEQGHESRPVAILGKGYYFGPQAVDHLIGSCIAFGGDPSPDSIVELLDSKGCPSDAALVNSVEFMKTEDDKGNLMKVKIKQMFRFPADKKDDIWTDNRVTIQCNSVPCSASRCPSPCTREAGQLLQESPSSRGLITTSVNVLDPGMECDHETKHQLTRDWLMALLFCVCILLLVMFCVNLFLCSSMACTCVKHEVVDTTSSIDARSQGHMSGYDYDPYKTDNQLYASLNRTKPRSAIETSRTFHNNYNMGGDIDGFEEYNGQHATQRGISSRHSNFY